MKTASGSTSGTIAALATETVDIPIDHSGRAALIIRNTGATNAIGTVAVSVSPSGTLFAELTAVGTAIGSLGTSASCLVEIDGLTGETLRVSLTSTSGSTYTVEWSTDGRAEGSPLAKVNGTVVGVESAGALSATTLTVSGATTLNGAVTLGDAAADDVTVSGVIAGSVSLKKEGAHTISIAASTTTDTVGGALTIAAGAGGATNADGGALSLDAGAKAGSGTDGAITIGGTSANSVAIGRSGKTTTVAGALAVTGATTLNGAVTLGDAAADDVTFTGVVAGSVSLKKEEAHTVSVAASTTTDTAGAALTIAAGAAAATNANGGALTLDAGAKAGSGTDGAVSIGATSAESVTIGRTGKTTTVPGALTVTQTLTVTGATVCNGAVTLGDAIGDAIIINGAISVEATDESGTPGNCTINKMAGRCAIALGAAAVTVTNSNVTAASLVFAQIATADATLLYIKSVVPGAGSFVVTGNANATAATNINWLVINPS